MTVITNPSTVPATVYFFVPPTNGERPFFTINSDEHGVRKSNFTREPHQVVIENLRGKENSTTLDTAGFQLFSNRPAKHTAFIDEEEVKKEYYPETIDLIKDVTGAKKVVIFDHTIRRRRPDEKEDTPLKRQPVTNAHVDQTPSAAVNRVHRHLPADEAPELLKHRFQIINLWRPISHAAIDWPLALCDFRSVDTKDVVPVALIYPDREGETYGVQYNPDQKWKYFYGMTPDEFVLIKCFDSKQDGSVALFTPHTAFQDSTTPPGTPLRESIEVRALVFYED